MTNPQVIIVTGCRKGIGKSIAEHFLKKNYQVIGCSRGTPSISHEQYRHFQLDVADEFAVKKMFSETRKHYDQLDALINNAGVASMNHSLLTPLTTVKHIVNTNLIGTFLCCREAAKIMKRHNYGRIINFTTFAVPFRLEGEAIYAAAKAGVITLTEILAREYADMGITVNAVSPPAVQTDLIRNVPKLTLDGLLKRQAIHQYGTGKDVCNVLDFFLRSESHMVTGQTIYLGGL